MYNLIPRASCLSDIGRQGLSIIGHLNINSIHNKFEMLSMSAEQYVDILMLSETKLDSTFPSIQFLINGFSFPHRLDQNSKNGGTLLYVRDKIIVLPLNRYSFPPHIEILFFELNQRNRKWLACCSYNPHKKLIKTIYFKKKNFMAPFHGWGSAASRLEPLRGDNLLFTTKFPEIPGTQL